MDKKSLTTNCTQIKSMNSLSNANDSAISLSAAIKNEKRKAKKPKVRKTLMPVPLKKSEADLLPPSVIRPD